MRIIIFLLDAIILFTAFLIIWEAYMRGKESAKRRKGGDKK